MKNKEKIEDKKDELTSEEVISIILISSFIMLVILLIYNEILKIIYK